jgi:hypothetical protein
LEFVVSETVVRWVTYVVEGGRDEATWVEVKVWVECLVVVLCLVGLVDWAVCDVGEFVVDDERLVGLLLDVELLDGVVSVAELLGTLLLLLLILACA